MPDARFQAGVADVGFGHARGATALAQPAGCKGGPRGRDEARIERLDSAAAGLSITDRMSEDIRREDDPVVGPGTPAFRCLAEQCGAMCCRNPYRVDLGEIEVDRLAGAGNVLDLFDERAAMVLMRQVDDACVLLGDDLRCGAYDVRPNGCRNYPFRLEIEDGQVLRVMRDLACPGFVGPPITESAYQNLVRELRRTSG